MAPTRKTLRRLVAAVLTTTILPLGACMSSQLGASAPLDSSTAPRGIPVSVVNHNYSDVCVYVLRGATRYPLGPVASGQQRTFAVPNTVVGGQGTLRLVAEPLGHGERDTHVSEWIPAGHGRSVEWTLAPALKMSSFVVR